MCAICVTKIAPPHPTGALTLGLLTNGQIRLALACSHRVRKELKIRPGFTPQEDVKRFRGTRQAQLDQNQTKLKGSIPGWAPAPKAPVAPPNNKNAKKRAAKKKKKATEEQVRESWDQDDSEDEAQAADGGNTSAGEKGETTSRPEDTADVPNSVSAPHGSSSNETESKEEELTSKMGQLEVR